MPVQLSFLVRVVYDILPSAVNLVKWCKYDALCLLCQGRPTLEHVLPTCKMARVQGQFMWRHNLVLKVLGGIVDVVGFRANKCAKLRANSMYFFKAGQVIESSCFYAASLSSFLDDVQECEYLA